MYINFIDRPEFGRLWFYITLRNCNVFGNTQEQNRLLGPFCELHLYNYSVIVTGKSPEEAVAALQFLLDIYARENMKLRPHIKVSWWRLSRLFKRYDREGKFNPIKGPYEELS